MCARSRYLRCLCVCVLGGGGISNCIQQYLVGWNNLPMPELPASGAKILIYNISHQGMDKWLYVVVFLLCTEAKYNLSQIMTCMSNYIARLCTSWVAHHSILVWCCFLNKPGPWYFKRYPLSFISHLFYFLGWTLADHIVLRPIRVRLSELEWSAC